jgi:hypothetical protein
MILGRRQVVMVAPIELPRSKRDVEGEPGLSQNEEVALREFIASILAIVTGSVPTLKRSC